MTHAILRARERYGLTIGKQDFDAIREQVATGRALKLRREARRTSVYLVTVQGIDAVIVYNRRAKWVLTFLPLHWER